MLPIVLRVIVNEAKNLKGNDINPFVTLSLLGADPGDYQKTTKKKATDSPIWGEEFEFLIKNPSEDKLVVKIYDSDATNPISDDIIFDCDQFKPGFGLIDISCDVVSKKKDEGNLKLSFEALKYIPEPEEKAKGKSKKSDAKKSDARKSDARKSDARKSDARKSDARKSDARKSDARKSDAKKEPRRSSSAKGKDLVVEPEYEVTYILNIEVVSARNLLSGDKKGRANPYVVLQLEGSPQKYISQPVTNSLNPCWNEKLSPIDGYFVSSDLLHVWIYHNDKKVDLKKNECLGLASTLISDVRSLGVKTDHDIPLFKVIRDKKTGAIVQSKRSHHGDAGYLKLRFHIAKVGDEPWIERPWKAEFLEAYLEMNDARKCPVMDGVKSSDPYVVLYISPAANKQRYQTFVQKQTLNPIWKEQVKFSIDDPTAQLIHFTMFHETSKMGKTKISFKGLRIGEVVEMETQLSNVGKQKGGVLRYRLTIVHKDQKPFILKSLPDDAKARDANIVEESDSEHCKWIWPSYNSSYSDSFDGYTTNSSTLSDFHSWEKRWHVHVDLPIGVDIIKLTRGIITGKIINCLNLIKLDDNPTNAYVQLNVLTKAGKEKGDATLTPIVEDNNSPSFGTKYHFERIKKGDRLIVTALQKLKDFGPVQLGVATIFVRNLQPGKQTLNLDFQKPLYGNVPTNIDNFNEFGQCSIKINYNLNE